MSSQLRSQNEEASKQGDSSRRNISSEYRKVMRDHNEAQFLKQMEIQAIIKHKKDQIAHRQALDLEKRGYDPKYFMGRTGVDFSQGNFATISAQSRRRNDFNKTSTGFGDSYRCKSTGG